MITRFDHTVIAVRDLDAAISAYRALGFEVNPGGRHTGMGTYNAIIRFGLDYIELLSVYDRAEAERGRGLAGKTLLEFFEKQEGGLVGYALATDDIQQEAERFRSAGLGAAEPFAMQRMRPDGHLLSWSLLVPGGVSWRRRWPFFIHWDVPDEQRLAWEKPGAHANGAARWAGISVGVHDLESAVDLYQRQIGLALAQRDDVPALAARRATFHLGSSSIDLLTPMGEGPVQRMLATVGEGPFEVRLAVKDLNQTRAFLMQHGIHFTPAPTSMDALLLSPDQAAGARIVLAQQSNM
ncbi:MAG TPA: VOC family protein [Ktedonobacteraceae bacterium]|jgi:catechol 2,3-dioxygenase-like lactoylglutathione lyase family enzyme|nr:VOC family protein [Ktedonobacteraceae bacterium]